MSNPNPMHSRCGLEDCDCGYVIEKQTVALEQLVDHLEIWEAKPKNLAYTALVAPKIAQARAAIQASKRRVT